jgi:hypothetical protein
MHPMFKELFIDADADDLAAERDRRHRVRRSGRARSAMIVRPDARNRENRSRLSPATRRPQSGYKKNRMMRDAYRYPDRRDPDDLGRCALPGPVLLWAAAVRRPDR